ncbi:hypothetical protein, partial [Methylomonas lenta]|uniref:hypothetical protein n=1 Tax=Methylomonas lenta TaxID=980561 RepID=UPI001E3202DA
MRQKLADATGFAEVSERTGQNTALIGWIQKVRISNIYHSFDSSDLDRVNGTESRRNNIDRHRPLDSRLFFYPWSESLPLS